MLRFWQKSPDYKFTKRKVFGKLKPLLIVFNAVNKDMCYKFGYDSCHKFYTCLECKKRGHTVSARFIQHNGETTIELGRLQHICEPQKYIHENFFNASEEEKSIPPTNSSN
uniref:Uncharacterized protein n=1 Tax=Panagrolaimus davidi TaxID=227884 RepID=A0A914QFH9_9BILA